MDENIEAVKEQIQELEENSSQNTEPNTENTSITDTVEQNSEKKGRWYIINVIPGRESKVVLEMKSEIEKHDVGHLLHEIFLPIENSTSVSKGSRRVVAKKMLPGYIMVRADLEEKLYLVLRGIQGVLGFLGGKNPKVVPESELAALKNTVNKIMEKEAKYGGIDYIVGDFVKILEGAFEGFNALVEEVDSEKKSMKVVVSIFGRETAISVSFSQVCLAKES